MIITPESSCTIYRFNGSGYDRYFIPECHWQENKARNVLKSGMQNADSVTVYIPIESARLLPGFLGASDLTSSAKPPSMSSFALCSEHSKTSFTGRVT